MSSRSSLRLSLAALILLAGMLVANAAARRVHAQTRAAGRPQADLLAALARGAILFFVAALALYQAGLPAVIVSMAFGAVVGGLAIGLAVAVGVGGGPAATRLWQRALDSFEPDHGALAHPPLGTASAEPPVAAAHPAASTSDSHVKATQASAPPRPPARPSHPPGPEAATP